MLSRREYCQDLTEVDERERFDQMGILQFESENTSDVDHDIEMERRMRRGELEQPAARSAEGASR